jgi:hypothetical protein
VLDENGACNGNGGTSKFALGYGGGLLFDGRKREKGKTDFYFFCNEYTYTYIYIHVHSICFL